MIKNIKKAIQYSIVFLLIKNINRMRSDILIKRGIDTMWNGIIIIILIILVLFLFCALKLASISDDEENKK